MDITNTVINHVKTALEKGIDANGATTSSAPTYGGTAIGEDFEGFNIYAETLNDSIEFGSLKVPLLLITHEVSPSSIEMYNDEPLNLTFTIHVGVNEFYGEAHDDGEEYINKEAVNVYVDRLWQFLKNVNFPDVKLLMRSNVVPIKEGGMAPGNSFYVTGSASIAIDFVEEI